MKKLPPLPDIPEKEQTGKNGYVTHIGNEWFAWFKSTSSKSRLNFLDILRAGHKDYCLSVDAIQYMEQHKLPLVQVDSDYVKKRKVSGGTCSDEGQRCRDTFISLKKTCRKLGISFWDFFARPIVFAPESTIPQLSDLVRKRASAPGY